MYVMGKYDRGHDASLCIVGEGRIVHLELERFTRVKHDQGDVLLLEDKALALMGIDRSQITAVAWSGHSHHLVNWPNMDLVQHREVEPSEYLIPHHLAHAAYAFYSSPFEKAGVVTFDGCGDSFTRPGGDLFSSCGSYGSARHGFGEAQGSWNMRLWLDESPGQWWNWKCDEILHESSMSAGKLMALGGVAASEFERTGFPESVRSDLQALQSKTNESFLRATHQAWQDDICFGGGAALNGLSVYEILKSREHGSVHVPPAVSDCGLSIGAAMYVLHAILGDPRPIYSTETLAFAGTNIPGEPDPGAVAEDLHQGRIVALAYGRAESGPRALGHRSLLALPLPELKDRLNAMKGRAWWRPVAPSILETSSGLFPMLDNSACRFMTTIAPASELCRHLFPAACHDDGTARVQVLKEKEGVLARVLKQIWDVSGEAMLLNTSFNGAGEAIVNDRAQALDTARRIKPDVLYVGSERMEGPEFNA